MEMKTLKDFDHDIEMMAWRLKLPKSETIGLLNNYQSMLRQEAIERVKYQKQLILKEESETNRYARERLIDWIEDFFNLKED